MMHSLIFRRCCTQPKFVGCYCSLIHSWRLSTSKLTKRFEHVRRSLSNCSPEVHRANGGFIELTKLPFTTSFDVNRSLSLLTRIPTRNLSSLTETKLRSTKSTNKSTKDRIEVEGTKWLTVPNVLTLGRLLVSPYIGYLVLCEEFTWALSLVFLASLTDSLDGWIARKFKGQASNIGSYIDPLADKVLISILTVTLTMVHIIPLPLCAMIIARDVLLVITSSHLHWKHIPPPKSLEKFFDFENSHIKMEPTQISKYNTFLQLGLVFLSVAAPVFQVVDHPVLQAYWCMVATTTVLSGFSYLVKDKSAYIIKK